MWYIVPISHVNRLYLSKVLWDILNIIKEYQFPSPIPITPKVSFVQSDLIDLLTGVLFSSLFQPLQW